MQGSNMRNLDGWIRENPILPKRREKILSLSELFCTAIASVICLPVFLMSTPIFFFYEVVLYSVDNLKWGDIEDVLFSLFMLISIICVPYTLLVYLNIWEYSGTDYWTGTSLQAAYFIGFLSLFMFVITLLIGLWTISHALLRLYNQDVKAFNAHR
jgi:hypothetical protein